MKRERRWEQAGWSNKVGAKTGRHEHVCKLPFELFSAQLKAGTIRNAKKGSARPGPSPALSQNLPGMAFLRPTVLEA